MEIERKECHPSLIAGLIGTGQLANVKVPDDFLFPDEGERKLYKIENCHFEGQVIFKELSFSKELIITNCQFDKSVFLTKCQFPAGIKFVDCLFSEDLFFKDPLFEFITFIGGQYSNLKFGGTLNKDVDTSDMINFESGIFTNLTFVCKEINAEINFNGGEFENVYLFNSTFHAKLNFLTEEVKINFINLRNCTFNDWIDLSTGHIHGAINIDSSTFNDRFIFRSTFLCKSMRFNNITAKQDVSINQNGNLESISLDSCDFSIGFECHYYGEEARNSDYNFSCSIHGIMKGNIVFNDIPVTSIAIGCYNFGNILFRNTFTHSITLNHLQNYSKITFANTRLLYRNQIFIVFDSNLGNTEFVNVDFRKFKEIMISRSDVSNISLSNSVLPARIQSGVKNPIYGYNISADESINTNMYYRESYRQLKVAMERQGNVSAALTFKSMEMYFLRKELNFGWDKALLYLNYYSNKHGLSWSRGIIFTLSISYILFLAYQLSLPHGKLISPIFLEKDQLKAMTSTTFTAFMEFLSSFPLYKRQTDHILT